MKLPRILVIDDQLGGVRKNNRNRLRESLCFKAGLKDITGDVTSEQIDNPIADAVFCRGQRIENNVIQNDILSTLGVVRKGWLNWPRWALLLVDMHFMTGPINENGEAEGYEEDENPEKYFGLTLIEQIRKDPGLSDIPIVILTSMTRTEIEKRFADQGVMDFIDKTELTRERLHKVIMDCGLVESESLIGRSTSFLKCLREARQRAKLGRDNILLIGETGTGKEVVARYIHNSSSRRLNPYITVYTQGVPETLIDDRLFGHVKGAFTDARTDRAGAAEEAHDGTLFIDEFGEIPATIQAKLLRLLDKNVRESQRMGAQSRAIRKLDLQVILATNRLDILNADDFRKDLLFRVRVTDPIRIPPLRERREDIPLLAEHFVQKYEKAFQQSHGADSRSISSDAMDSLVNSDWPDNVRGLEQAIESAVYRFPKLRILSPSHLRLSANIFMAVPGKKSDESPSSSQHETEGLDCLLTKIERYDFAKKSIESQLVGRYPVLQTSFARAAAGMLKAAIMMTKRPTPKNPDGDIKIHPAVKMLMGQDDISASQAADIIKRLLNISTSDHEEILNDPVLRQAYDTAVRLRPKRPQKKRGN
ncbi:MAG: sigma 54-interacting transcriptional regulator [Acidobacteriota bacterium]|nr:sigma 54-interacting transcriptional regulator [Acidobacteriota bacterium]